MVRNRYPPTAPAKATVPAVGATTTVPDGAAMSIPRCPDPYGEAGGSNARMTGPVTGQSHVPPAALACAAGTSVAAATRNSMLEHRRMAGDATPGGSHAP